MSMMIPISENIFNVCPNTFNVKTAPASARGTVIMMINGSRKLSNCADRIRKIRPNARKKAKAVLDELSAKSREAPLKDVAKDSSKTLSAIRCISAMPSHAFGRGSLRRKRGRN